ncbi:tRNA (guanosine(37)-N1)-methyltransferase TrmD [Orrella sp. 11846]|uniref:tRNA (guanosine(37)-N1)-methyltransferase TrmD n=1 Tax=Orrella sp. 11846 TaxID=3409913 RepID=UPI003B58F285
MRIDAITLFPEFFTVLTQLGITGRAHERGLWSFHAWNPRDYVQDVHRTIDDRPYGGGPGMVMMAPPLDAALTQTRQSRGDDRAPVVLLAPGGKVFNQAQATALSQTTGAIFVCGRYEGIDQRFIDRHVDEQWSLGDFVLSGGEPALLPMLDATIRLLPGALGESLSHAQDSFATSLDGLLDCQHYTRPDVYEGQPVPEILRSGHHANIERWRREQSLRLTAQFRPDLIEKARNQGKLTAADEKYLRQL